MRFLSVLAVAILVALVAAGMTSSRADDARSPVAGTWKVCTSIQGQDIALAIIKVEVADGKASAMVVATGAPIFSGVKVKTVKAGERSLHLTFKTAATRFDVAVYGGKDGRRPRFLPGSITIRHNVEAAFLERTTEMELDSANPVSPTEGAAELKRLNTKDDKEREQVLKEVLDKYGDRPVAYTTAQRVWQTYSRRGKSVDQLAEGTKFVNLAARFGRELEMGASLQVAGALLKSEEDQGKAVAFARRAEKLLSDDDAPARHIFVLKALAAALRKAVKADDNALREVEARVAKIEDQLDCEFEKTAIPFTPEPFPGRKGTSKRAAVFELFTGSHCPPCVAADITFDALLQTYKSSEVVLLQYHLHAPAPDPLANADTEARAELYGVDGTPTAFVNGKVFAEIGGDRKSAESKYTEVTKALNRSLEREAKAGLDISVTRDGDKFTVTTKVTALDTKGEARLRVMLVEDVVRYAGSNGQRLHHHVVRAILGDVAANKDATPYVSTASLSELRKSLSEYLEQTNKTMPFLDDERPLVLKKMKVVALVQEKEGKEILYAVQADLPEGK